MRVTILEMVPQKTHPSKVNLWELITKIILKEGLKQD